MVEHVLPLRLQMTMHCAAAMSVGQSVSQSVGRSVGVCCGRGVCREGRPVCPLEGV
jgi:hypothetical protein